MKLLFDKRDAILADINSVNERMKAIEEEHARRIVQLHELRGAQRVVDALIEESEHLMLAEQRATELEKQFTIEEMEQLKSQAILPGLEELSDHEKEKLGIPAPTTMPTTPFKVGDRVKVIAEPSGWALFGMSGSFGEVVSVDEDTLRVCFDDGSYWVPKEALEHV